MVPECCALWRAMKFYSEMELNQIEFEGDAQVMIHAINKEEEC